MDNKLQHALIPFIMMMSLLWIGNREISYLKETIEECNDNNIILSEDLMDVKLQKILLSDKNNAWKELFLSLPLSSPLDTLIVTSPYGWRINPKTELREHHDGVDLLAGPWDKVYATRDCIVVRANWYKGLGNCIVIKHVDGYRSLYGHLSEIKVSIGQEVKCNEHIGMAGNTGYTEGYHLHYEIYKDNNRTNPMEYIKIGEAL